MESRAARIEKSLLAALSPTVLIIEDESHQHGAHRKVRTADRALLHDHVDQKSVSQVEGLVSYEKRSPETHFKVLVVSTAFQGLARVPRQRQVHELLADEFKKGLHALTIRALTPEEYASGAAKGFVSPSCANRAQR